MNQPRKKAVYRKYPDAVPLAVAAVFILAIVAVMPVIADWHIFGLILALSITICVAIIALFVYLLGWRYVFSEEGLRKAFLWKTVYSVRWEQVSSVAAVRLTGVKLIIFEFDAAVAGGREDYIAVGADKRFPAVINDFCTDPSLNEKLSNLLTKSAAPAEERPVDKV